MRVPELTIVLVEPEAESGSGARPSVVFAGVPVPEPEAPGREWVLSAVLKITLSD